MALSSKVHDYIRLLLLKQLIYTLTVAYIKSYETEVIIVQKRRNSGHIPCIGKLIGTNNPDIGILLSQVEYEIRTDKSCTACNNYRLIRVPRHLPLKAHGQYPPSRHLFCSLQVRTPCFCPPHKQDSRPEA